MLGPGRVLPTRLQKVVSRAWAECVFVSPPAEPGANYTLVLDLERADLFCKGPDGKWVGHSGSGASGSCSLR